MSALAKMRPQQRQCSIMSCRRRSTIGPRDMYKTLMSSRGGGTHMDGAWKCPGCGMRNIIPASHLPKGVLQLLPHDPDTPVNHRRAPTPLWKSGADGRRMLNEALAKAKDDATSVIAPMVRRQNGLVAVSTRDAHGRILPSFQGDAILATLDGLDCVALIISGEPKTGPWTVVFDPRSGAASLAS